jgi:hypothetical protein
MKQTAVEWLHQKLATSSQEELVENINFMFMQAKAMEKEQIIDAYLNDRPKAGIDKALKLWDQAEQYYISNYNS